MHHTASIALFEHAQPHSRVWRIGVEYASTWNRAHASQFVAFFNTHLNIVFNDRREPACTAVLADLDALGSQHGLVWDVVYTRVYDEADFDDAPLVGLYGTGVDERPGAPFVLNAQEAFGKSRACPVCGRPRSLPGPQLEDMAIDESYLDGPGRGHIGDGPEPPRDWDLITLPRSTLLVSPRLVDTLKSLAVDCWQTRPLRVGRTRRASERAVQLVATQPLPAPDPQETTIRDGWMCPGCGVFDGQLEGEIWLRKADLAGDEIFGNWGGRLPLYVTQRVYKAVREAGMTGLAPRSVIHLVSEDDRC